MEVGVVTGREELAKEHYYGEGGVAILSFHILIILVVMMMMRILVVVMRKTIILLRTVHIV